MKDFGRAMLRYAVIIIVVGVIAFLATNGMRILNENNDVQREAKLALEDYLTGNRELPVGEYVSLNARWVIGPFASETSTSTTNGIKATSGVAYYYYVILDDMSIMVLKVQNVKDKAVLDRMSDWLLSRDGFPMNGETLKVQGTLRELKDQDLLKLYRNGVTETFSIAASDPAVRMLVLDLTAGREQLYYILFGAAALIALGVFLFVRTKRKVKEQDAAVPPAE